MNRANGIGVRSQGNPLLEYPSMNQSPYIVDLDAENFGAIVIEGSHRTPVLVDFWADWCGPCQMQLPILLKLAEEYQGKFMLAKLDTEQQRELAAAFQIRSIPTMKLFKDGEIVEDILGAQTEATLREVLDRHIPRATDADRLAARAAFERGERENAMQQLRQAIQKDPENHGARLDLAQMALETGQLEVADSMLQALPKETRDQPDAVSIAARLDFARIAGEAPDMATLQQAAADDDTDLESRYRLAAHQVTGGDYEAAFEQLLEVMGKDRAFRDDGARKALLSLFQVLGEESELTGRYRKRLFNLLH